MPDPLTRSRSILDDLAAGESPLTLNAARRESIISRDGRSPDLSSMYRAVGRGWRGIVLESVVIGSRRTTRSALLRWVARMSGARAVEQHQGRQLQREHAEAEQELAALI
jgi:hypothetical protein